MLYDAPASSTPDQGVASPDLLFQRHLLPDSSDTIVYWTSNQTWPVRRSAAAADKSGGMGAPDNGKPRTAPAAVQRPTAMEATPAVPNAQIAGLTI